MNKEQVYDEQINPLMAQVIAICKEHKIATICTFSLDDLLLCSTTLLKEETDPPVHYLMMFRILTEGEEDVL